MLPAVTKKNALSRALERFKEERPQAPAPKVEPLRPVEGPVNEVTIRSRCAVTGGYYRTVYRRSVDDGKFVPVMQMTEAPAPFAGFTLNPSPRAGLTLAEDPPSMQRTVVPMSEFRHMRQWPCPCCNKKMVYSEIRCSCGQWVCTGRSYVNEQGTFIHVCHDDCGVRAPLGATPVKSCEAERVAPAAPKAAPPPAGKMASERNKALTHTSLLALPPKDKHPLLPGSKKR